MDLDLKDQLEILKAQITSLESLHDTSVEVAEILRELRACCNEVETVQRVKFSVELDTGSKSDKRSDTTTYGIDSNGEDACLLSDVSCRPFLNKSVHDEVAQWTPACGTVYHGTWVLSETLPIRDSVLKSLLGKACRLRQTCGFLNSTVVDFLWSIYLYEALKVNHLVAFCERQLNGSYKWFVGYVIKMDYAYYVKSDIEKILQDGFSNTLLGINKLEYEEIPEGVNEADMNGLNTSRFFFVVSRVYVVFAAPERKSHVPCRFINSTCNRQPYCRYDHGKCLVPSCVRLLTLKDISSNLEVGCTVNCKYSVEDSLWSTGEVLKKKEGWYHVADKHLKEIYEITDSSYILPKFESEYFSYLQLPGDQLPDPLPSSFGTHHTSEQYVTDEKTETHKTTAVDCHNETTTLKESPGHFVDNSLADIFGGWEKYSKGFGLRMLTKMGYKHLFFLSYNIRVGPAITRDSAAGIWNFFFRCVFKGEPLSPPSWKPIHPPKCVEPLKIRILCPRAGLDYANRGRDVHFRSSEIGVFEAKEKKCREKEANSNAFGYINHVLAQPISMVHTKKELLKPIKSLQHVRHEKQSEIVLRKKLLWLEQQKTQFLTEMKKIKNNIKRHEGSKNVSALRSQYACDLQIKSRKLEQINEVCQIIRQQLESMSLMSVLKIF